MPRKTIDGPLSTSRELLVSNLIAYGETEVADKVMKLSDRKGNQLSNIAFDHAYTGMLLDKALCLAAVEVITGKRRPLKRTRRRFTK